MFTIERQNLANLSNNSTQDLNKDEKEREFRKKKIRQNSFSGIFASLSSEYCDVKVIKDDILNASLL